MSSHATPIENQREPKTARPSLPQDKLGWSAIIVAGVSAVSWVLLPVLGALIGGDRYPMVSSATMVTAMAIAIGAAVFNLLCVSIWKQRSVLNLLAAALTVPTAVIILAEAVSIVVGEL